jgi:hypothetical protein
MNESVPELFVWVMELLSYEQNGGGLIFINTKTGEIVIFESWIMVYDFILEHNKTLLT